MAQVVKLKRTSVQGRVPSISNLELGELAINTYDGRIFFEKDDGTLSIQEILTTNSQTSGSFTLDGQISASSLSISGDSFIGGNLTLGGNINIGDSNTDSVSFTADVSSSFLPDSNLEFDLGSQTKKWNNLYVGTASADYFVGDGSLLTNLQAAIIETATVTASFDNQSEVSILHSFDSKNVIVSVYDTNYSQIIPQEVRLVDDNTVNITLSSTGSGHVVLANGGHVVSGSRIQIDEITSVNDTFTNQTSYTVNHTFETKNVFVSVYGTDDEQIIPATVSTPTTSSIQLGFDNPTSGRVVIGKAGHVISGYSLADGTIHSQPFIAQSEVTASHNFNTKDVITYVYDNDDNLIWPTNIKTATTDEVHIKFNIPRTGRVVVSKGGHIISGSVLEYSQIRNVPSGIVSSSNALTGSNVVGSDTLSSIETMTSASYAAITPVSGTLYIIID